MAKISLVMENPNTGLVKEACIGICLNPPIYMLLRGEIKLLFAFVVTCTPFTLCIGGFYFMAKYNKIYITKLLEKGYKVSQIRNGTLQEASAKLGINLPELVK